MRKLTIAIVTLSILLATSLTALGVVWGVYAMQVNDYKLQLDNVYKNNFYELSDNINNIESNLSKLSVSPNKELTEKYLTEVVSLCNDAQANIASMPLDHNTIDEATKYINQLGGYAFTLHQKVVSGSNLTMDDEDQLDSLHETSLTIKYELNRLANMINQGYSIVDNSEQDGEHQSGFSGEWSGFSTEMVEYPQLIYDGPFSDSVMNQEIKGLPEDEITETEAKLIVAELFNDWKVTSSGESTGGDFDTYNYVIEKEDVSGYVQITKRGGMLLQYNTDAIAGKSTKTLKECEVLAEEFAKKAKFENTKVVWSTESNGFVYCNLVYMIDDIIVYPDMIKVKVDKTNGGIIGWEARSWAFNHTNRSKPTATITKEEAQKVIDTDLEVLTTEQCITPGEYVGEVFAYEFKCLSNNEIYYVYVDANTGVQFRVLKIIETDNGELLM